MNGPIRIVTVAMVGVLGIVAAACGPTVSGSNAASEGDGGRDGGAFPVTIEHRLGETTISQKPERVFTVGWNDQDFVLALGVVPVGTRGWFDEYSTYPWVTEATQGEELPTVSDIDFEEIAATEPDLILAVYEEFDERVYERLSQIAPTVLQPEDYADSTAPWDVQLDVTAEALGKKPEADALTAKVEKRIESARSEHPEFAGKTLVVDYGPEDDGHWLVPAGDPRRALFDQLGFEAQEHNGDLSAERLDLLDEDVLVVFGATESELTSPTFTNVPVVREGRTLYVGWETIAAGAMSYSGPEALIFALDQVVPELAKAVDDDPATSVGDVE